MRVLSAIVGRGHAMTQLNCRRSQPAHQIIARTFATTTATTATAEAAAEKAKTPKRGFLRNNVDLIVLTFATIVATTSLHTRYEHEDKLEETEAQIKRLETEQEEADNNYREIHARLTDQAEEGLKAITSATSDTRAQLFIKWIEGCFDARLEPDDSDKPRKRPALI